MSRLLKAACCVLAFLVTATVTLPVESTNIMAAEAELMQVAVIDGGKQNQYATTARQVEEFLEENDIQLNAKDLCSLEMTDEIKEGMEIVIDRAVTVSASIDGIWEKRRVKPGTTVGQLQTLMQNEYGDALYYEGSTERILKDEDKLKLSTLRSETLTRKEDIPFETHEMETTAVLAGRSLVRQEGVLGQKEITTAEIYIGGKLNKSSVISERILKEPIPHIIDVGIGGNLGTTTNTSSPDFHYIQKLTMNASAYTAGFESTGKNPGDPGYGRTAMGLQVTKGIVSVDPSVIPLGTKLYVEGYGFALAADTGSGIKGHMIDLFYESLNDAIQFGRRNLDVYVLE